MKRSNKVEKSYESSFLEIPNVCRNSNVLAIVIITQLMITIVWLAGDQSKQWDSLGLWSLYGQWVVLLTTFVLCFTRNAIKKVSYWFGCFWVVATCLFSLLLVEVITRYWMAGFSTEVTFDLGRLIRLSIVVLLLSVTLLRFFEFLVLLEQRNKAETQSRLLALQARIQPHFLFNSLNTISELVLSDAQQAEKAIHSLSMLFRASLENERKFHSCENEFTLCERYIDLERWRLGEHLKIKWSKHIEKPSYWRIPKLLMQPLIENAIVHGRQDNGDVEIQIDIRESNRHLSIMIENIKSKTTSDATGNGIAFDNIRERLQVLYDDQQNLRVKESDTKYSVLVRIPKQAYSIN